MKNLLKYMKTSSWVVTVMMVLLTASCKDDDDNSVKGFAIDQTELRFENNGGTIELKVATDQTWTAESESDWCLVSPATGVGSGICVIKADSSYLYKSRTGRVVFYTDKGDIAEISINQFGYEPTIELSEAEKTIPSYAAPDEAFVDVEAIGNVPFEVLIPEEVQEWLSIDGTSSYTPSTTIPRKQKFRFKFKTNTSFKEERIAEVELKQTGKMPDTRVEGEPAGLLKKVVRIIQEKAPVIIPSREGDSLAVLAIARTLNASLTIPASRPITHWDNVMVEERTYRYNYDGIDKDSTELRIIGFSLSMIDTKESLPYQVQYLTELETLAATGNSNAFLKSIELGPEIAQLTKLKSLSLMGYGINSLPKEMANMASLEELDLNGNCILRLETIKDVLLGLKGHLKYLDLGSNRISGSVMNLSTDIPKNKTLETIGLGGDLSNYGWLFEEMSELETLILSYNYFYGSVPDFDNTKDGILPKARYMAINLNRLTGKVPNWILYHKNLACWNPFLLVFNQEGYDNKNTIAGFPNAPIKFSDFPEEYNRVCPEEEKAQAVAAKLPQLTEAERGVVPLHGNWRYYKTMLNEKWYLDLK